MNEKQTRKQLIDKQLKNVGWISKYVKKELKNLENTKKSREKIDNLFNALMQKSFMGELKI